MSLTKVCDDVDSRPRLSLFNPFPEMCVCWRARIATWSRLVHLDLNLGLQRCAVCAHIIVAVNVVYNSHYCTFLVLIISFLVWGLAASFAQ